MNQLRKELIGCIGLALGALLLTGGALAFIYALLSTMTDTGRHLLAAALVFVVPLAYALGLAYARAHRAGLEHGVDLKISTRERIAAKPTPAQAAQAQAAVQRAEWDRLLPKLGGAVIVRRHGSDSDVIDL